MELQVQKFLRQGHSLTDLKEAPYNLFIKQANGYVILKYNQLESDFSEPIVQECRGLILSEKDWSVVCFPFVKFFNEGEPYAATLKGSIYVYEKIDGSLLKVWFSPNDNEWVCASNSRIYAEKKYLTLLDKALASYGLTWEQFTKPLNKKKTYIYELATEENQMVILYKGYHLYYLGERDITTYKEAYNPDLRIENVKQYSFKTLDEVVASAEKLPDNAEGYVVRDNRFMRIKVKNPRYFYLHHLAGNGHPDVLSYVLDNNTDELLAYFPQYTEEVLTYRKQILDLKKMVKIARRSFEKTCGTLTKKEYSQIIFSGSVIDVPVYLQPFLCKVYDRPNSVWQEYVNHWNLRTWKEVLPLVEEDFARFKDWEKRIKEQELEEEERIKRVEKRKKRLLS